MTHILFCSLCSFCLGQAVICCTLQGEDLRAKRKARHPRPMSCRCLCQCGFVFTTPRSLDGHLSSWKKTCGHRGQMLTLAMPEHWLSRNRRDIETLHSFLTFTRLERGRPLPEKLNRLLIRRSASDAHKHSTGSTHDFAKLHYF